MQNVNTSIYLDIYNHDTTPSVIKAISLDSHTRFVSAVIQDRGALYDIGQDTTVTLTVIRPDGTGVQITGQPEAHTDITPEDTEVTTYGAYAELSQAALAVDGTLQAQFMLTSGEQILRTEIFTINVGKALDASTSTWAGEYQGYNLDELVQDVSELKEELEAIEVSTNLDITTNGFVDTSGRVQTGDGTWKRSRYIPIDSINTLQCSFWAHRAVLNISFWTESFTFISGLGNTTRPEWGHASTRTYTLDPTDIPSNAVYLMYCTSTSNSNNYCTVTLKSHEFDIVGKKYACLGDSITSDQVVGIGTLVNDILNTKLVGNFACGYAICSNWHTGETDESPQSFQVPQNTNTADNVLMNQVLRLLQWTTALDAQVTWTHPIAGAFSVPTSVGTGLGHTDDIPDVIYIAIGVNDGRNAKNLFVDDSDAVMSSTYADLTKCSYASALRWAIETLNSAYPNAQIFVASPLFTNENDGTSNGHHNRGAILAKREVSKKIANYCNAFFIDSTYESGYTVLAATQVNNIHPNGRYKNIIGRYVASEIKRRYVRGTAHKANI